MRKAVLIISVIGLLVSLYGVQLHYGSGDSFCDIGETFSCDKVNKSIYSELFGIPVAILGALAYLTVFMIVLKEKLIVETLGFTRKDLLQYLFSLVVIMVGFQLYLTGIEIFVLHAYCLVCLVSQLCTILITFFVARELYF